MHQPILLKSNLEYLCFQIKKKICGQKFDTDAKVKSTVRQFSKAIPKEEFKKIIHIRTARQKRQCIHANSQYFEKHLQPPNLSDLRASD